MCLYSNHRHSCKHQSKKHQVGGTTSSEIDKLSEKVRKQRESAESWDTWNIRFLFIAGFAALCLVVTAIGVSRSNRTLTDLSDELDRAKDRKLQADLKSKDDEIAGLGRDTAIASKDAADARRDAEKFKLDIAQANERAAKAELETEHLRKQIADRTLTDAQVVAIGNKLKAFVGQQYTVTAYWDSKESLAIANRIHTALHDVAKWSYSDEGSKAMMLGGVVGVMVWTHPDADETTKHAARGLIDALNAEGVEAVPKEQNPKNPKTNMIAVNVGSKR